MDTATGIIPENLFEPRYKDTVIQMLSFAPMPGKMKARILKDWAKWTGVTLRAQELTQLERSGVEASPQIKLPGER